MNMKKWYKRIIRKTSLYLRLNANYLTEYIENQAYGEGQTKIMRFHMEDLKTGKDCVVEIKICE